MVVHGGGVQPLQKNNRIRYMSQSKMKETCCTCISPSSLPKVEVGRGCDGYPTPPQPSPWQGREQYSNMGTSFTVRHPAESTSGDAAVNLPARRVMQRQNRLQAA